jgi:DNA-binding NarL/FixJ family response regulator
MASSSVNSTASVPMFPETDGIDPHRWTRDMGAMLALPALWLDHEPREIASGLLSVLAGVLRLDGAYARFEGRVDGEALDASRPAQQVRPAAIERFLERDDSRTGLIIEDLSPAPRAPLRVARLSLPLPWETGVVVVWAHHADFPTATEAHVLRVAVSQAAIAIHTARRLARERTLRIAAEAALEREQALLRELAADVTPVLLSVSNSLEKVSGALDAAQGVAPASAYEMVGIDATPSVSPTTDESRHRPALTARELEVLGLLAQGLSNREIAGMLWLSDRTVERHITGIYRKIGVARRSEATHFALTHRLR